MTVPLQTIVNSYTSAGTSTFIYSFQALRSSHIVVTVNGITKTLGTDYAVTGVGVQAGGTITGLATVAGDAVVIKRVVPLERMTDYQNNGDLLATTLNPDFDAIWQALQQLQQYGAKSVLRVQDNETLTQLAAAATRAGKMPVFNASTGDVELSTFTFTQVASAVAAAYAAGSTADAVTFLQGGIGALIRSVQSWMRETVRITDFTGCDPTGATSSTTAIQSAVAKLGSFGTIELPDGTFAFNVDLGGARINFKGAGMNKTFIKSFTAAASPIVYGANRSWDYVYVEDLTLMGDTGTRTKVGVQFGHSIYATNDEFSGRAVFNRVKFIDLDKCVSRLYGNIGVYFYGCYFSNANYHLWSKGHTSTLMHGGCSFAKDSHFDSAQLAVVYVDSPQIGTGQFITENCIMEGNPGMVFFIKNFNDTALGEGFVIKATWNEGNCTAGSVTIDGVAYSPKHIYAANTPHLRVEDTTMGPVQLVNSRLTTRNCNLDFMTLTMDSASTCFHDEAVMDSCSTFVGMVRSIKMMKRQAGNFASWAKIPHHRIQAKVSPLTLLYSQYFAEPIAFAGTVGRNSTNATEGVLYNQSTVQDLVINPGENLLPSGSSFLISANKYYAWFFTYRNITGGGVAPNLSITYSTTLVSNITLDQTGWTTIGGITDTIGEAGLPLAVYMYLSGGASAATLRMAAFAIVECSTLQEATEFINDQIAPV
jgi:hypothetical protein